MFDRSTRSEVYTRQEQPNSAECHHSNVQTSCQRHAGMPKCNLQGSAYLRMLRTSSSHKAKDLGGQGTAPRLA